LGDSDMRNGDPDTINEGQPDGKMLWNRDEVAPQAWATALTETPQREMDFGNRNVDMSVLVSANGGLRGAREGRDIECVGERPSE